MDDDALMKLMLQVDPETKRIPPGVRAIANAVEAAERERCAKLCEDISDEYQRREGTKYPELKTDAQTGASDCMHAILRA